MAVCLVTTCHAQGVELSAAIESGQVELKLIGNGSRTSRTQLLLKNLTDESLEVSWERFTVLTAAQRQKLALLKGKRVTLPPRQAAKTTQPTLCAGRPSDLPATKEPKVYTATFDKALAETLAGMTRRVKEAKSQNRLPALPIPPALEVSTVTQLAFWREFGSMTREGLKAEIMTQMGLANANAEQAKELEQAVEHFWKASDLALVEKK